MTVENKLSAPKRRTRAGVQKLVAEFVSSGIQGSEFCRSRGLSCGTLHRHLKKQRWDQQLAHFGDPAVQRRSADFQTDVSFEDHALPMQEQEQVPLRGSPDNRSRTIPLRAGER